MEQTRGVKLVKLHKTRALLIEENEELTNLNARLLEQLEELEKRVSNPPLPLRSLPFRLVSRSELASMLSVASTCIDKLLRDPENPLPHFKIGRKTVFKPDEVMDYLEERRRERAVLSGERVHEERKGAER